MKNIKNNSIFNGGIFLVLVPHKDARAVMLKHSESLYKNGLRGAYSFPGAAPIASLNQPLSPDELKHFARYLKNFMGNNKFYVTETSFAPMEINGKDMILFGNRIDPDITTGALSGASFTGAGKINSVIQPFTAGLYFAERKNEKEIRAYLHDSRLSDFNVSFRAAAAANMFWKPYKDTAYKWRIEKLSWLPKSKKF